MGGILSAIGISARGLSVQRAKMNVVAENIANAETMETPEGGPYKRQRVTISENRVRTTFNSELERANGRLTRTHSRHMSLTPNVRTQRTYIPTADMEIGVDKESGFRLIHDPSHPLADEDGYIKMPDIEIVNEMVDMMAAARAYEANTAAISAAKQMAKDALDI